MARRSQCSSAGDNPLDPNYLPPHYLEEYRLAIDALVEEDLEGYYKFLQKADVVDFLSTPEIQFIQSFIHIPQQSYHPDQQSLETGGDGSSDTYWPIHSDQDVPGLDLGWPQLHHFIGPTEVTTLVNPPEPDMPSIKEQARRLIKNAQQVIAIVMDMFTDVDIFADILNAAMRSVAVYILLDEQNTDHFLNMVSNCRVNLQSIQFLRVRTVSGITYHCRSGKSFKGQMMDRFLLTDCRAVLSGNYSYMWSFEKLHRCMAHLFLGQLVSTFDEEFRILFAQSQPLMTENTAAPVEDFGPLQKRQYPSERTLFREPRKFLALDSEERMRHSYDERMDVDWRMMHLKRQEPQHNPVDVYSRFPSQQPRMDHLSYDQGPFRMSLLENPALKRHSYAEGVQGRYSYQPQGMPETEIHGRHFQRGQQPFQGPIPGPIPEPDYSAYDKFWNQDFQSDQYSESGLPQEIQQSDNFDPVLNYLSSTRNVDFDQNSEKLVPEPELPFSSSHPRRLNIGQSHANQTSPPPSHTTEQKLFIQESNTDRKDPTVKRGLRNWRISSYLNTYDNPGDEGLPLAPAQAPEPFDEPSVPLQQTAPGIDMSFSKIPNVREFKIPAVPRASHMPCYTKTAPREQPKKLPDELTTVEPEAKTTPTPSESSSTAEGEKAEEVEQKEPKTTTLLRDESFRRKYSATPRASRLRSSLIFSSLDQQHPSQDNKTAQGQQDDENDKNEAEQTKLPLVSHVLGQRRSSAREPFEWSRYIKSTTFDNSTTETAKPNDGNSTAADGDQSKVENVKDPSDISTADKVEESLKLSDVEQANSSPSIPHSKPSETKLPTTDQPVQTPVSLLTMPSYVDMSDPDKRLMFFKELALQRKAAKAAEAEKSKDKTLMKPTDLKSSTTHKKQETDTKTALEKEADTSQSDVLSEKDVNTNTAGKTTISSDSENKELKICEPTTSIPVSAERESPQHEPLKDLKLSNPAFKVTSLASTNATGLSSEQGPNRNEIPKQHGLIKNAASTPQSCKEKQTKISTDSEKELEISQTTSLPISAETEQPSHKTLKDCQKEVSKENSISYLSASTNTTLVDVPSAEQGPDGNEIPKQDSLVKIDVSTSQSCKEEQTKLSSVTEELEVSQPAALLVAGETEPPQHEPFKDLMLSKPAVKESSLSHPPPSTNATLANVPSLEQDSNQSQFPKKESLVKNDSEKELEISQPTSLPISEERETPSDETLENLKLSKPDVCPTSTHATPANVPSSEQGPYVSEIPSCDSTSKESSSLIPSSKEETLSSRPAPPAEKLTGSELTSSKASIQSSHSNPLSTHPGSQIKTSLPPFGSTPYSSPEDSVCATVTTDSSSTLVSSILSACSDKIEALEPVSSSPPESSQTADETSKDFTESASTQSCLQSVSQLTSSEMLSAVDCVKVESHIAPDTCRTLTEPNIVSLQSTPETNSNESCALTNSENKGFESGNNSASNAVLKESKVHSSSEDIKSKIKPQDLSPISPNSDLPNVSNLGPSTSRPDQTETSTVHQLASLSTANASPQKQATPPSELNLTGLVSPAPVGTVSRSSPVTESGGSVLSPEAERTETNMSTSCSPSDTPSLPKQINSKETPLLPTTETSCPTEPTSTIPTEPEPTPELVISESQAPEPSEPAEKSKKDQQREIRKEPELSASGYKTPEDVNNMLNIKTQDSVISEKTNDQVKANNCSEKAEVVPNQVISLSSQSKQPKTSQSRYQSSTANVLSSSNLRDDTKLLLEQISANSQSRNEATKESPVTDDEKEDEADKNAKRETERRIGALGKGQPKTTQERDKLLERIQSMRKERKVYSRFQMAP